MHSFTSISLFALFLAPAVFSYSHGDLYSRGLSSQDLASLEARDVVDVFYEALERRLAKRDSYLTAPQPHSGLDRHNIAESKTRMPPHNSLTVPENTAHRGLNPQNIAFSKTRMPPPRPESSRRKRDLLGMISALQAREVDELD